jgi:predicted transcriptional regulator
MRFVYQATDIAKKKGCVIVFSVDSTMLSQREMSHLRVELKLIHDVADSEMLDTALMEILRFINMNQTKGVSTTFKQIRSEFSISSVTTRKRITELVDLGLLVVKKKGRNKYLQLTEKALSLF